MPEIDLDLQPLEDTIFQELLPFLQSFLFCKIFYMLVCVCVLFCCTIVHPKAKVVLICFLQALCFRGWDQEGLENHHLRKGLSPLKKS